MSGRSYSGRGRAGRGSGRSSAGGSKSTTTEHKKQVMEFTPQIAGKHQSLTFDAVKEHILQEIQTKLKNGSDLAVNLRRGTDTGMPEEKPVREIAKPDTLTKFIKAEEGTIAEMAEINLALQKAEDEELAIEQKGLDMEYSMDLKDLVACYGRNYGLLSGCSDGYGHSQRYHDYVVRSFMAKWSA